jgi:putative oxidoreductase
LQGLFAVNTRPFVGIYFFPGPLCTPGPLASAVAATLVQFICSLFIVVGLFTRINAALLACALCGAILHNLLASRDPQLAILYTLVVVTLVFSGGGKYSLDARISSKT